MNQPILAGDERRPQRRLAGIEMAVVLDHVDGVPVGLLDDAVDGVGGAGHAHVVFDQGPDAWPSGCGRWR